VKSLHQTKFFGSTVKTLTKVSKSLGATFVLFNLQENQTLSNIWKLCIKKLRFKNAIFEIKNLEKRSKGTYQKYPQKNYSSTKQTVCLPVFTLTWPNLFKKININDLFRCDNRKNAIGIYTLCNCSIHAKSFKTTLKILKFFKIEVNYQMIR